MTIVERALELVSNESRLGLGSGRAAQAFVKALGARIRNASGVEFKIQVAASPPKSVDNAD